MALVDSSMALVDYSSEEEPAAPELLESTDDEGDIRGGLEDYHPRQNGHDDQAQLQEEVVVECVANAPSSSLLSPDEAFAEITGPPEFLKHAITSERLEQQQQHQQKKTVEAVVEAKPQLVARSNTEAVANEATAAAGDATPRVLQPQNPSAQDAADLLRMCVQCGVPKTSSEGRMVCPVCRDRPRSNSEPEQVEKKRAPKVKDKEKSKRMKGQSSHATWKSETEMQLRQQFD